MYYKNILYVRVDFFKSPPKNLCNPQLSGSHFDSDSDFELKKIYTDLSILIIKEHDTVYKSKANSLFFIAISSEFTTSHILLIMFFY